MITKKMNNIYEKNHAKKGFEKPFINPFKSNFYNANQLTGFCIMRNMWLKWSKIRNLYKMLLHPIFN